MILCLPLLTACAQQEIRLIRGYGTKHFDAEQQSKAFAWKPLPFRPEKTACPYPPPAA